MSETAENLPATVDDPNVALHLIAPVLAAGATMIVRRVLDSSYRHVTGHEAPGVRDNSTRLIKVLAWAAVTAVVAAEIEVLVYRIANRPAHEG